MEGFITALRNNIRLLLGAAVVIFIAILLITFILNRTKKVVVNGQTFNVKIADTEKERQIGLSKTEKLGENDGMLFLFDKPGIYPFWMKEMKFPIDIIYINGETVTTVIDSAKPLNTTEGDVQIFEPDEESDRVLEIPAGSAKKYDIKKGTTLEIEGR